MDVTLSIRTTLRKKVQNYLQLNTYSPVFANLSEVYASVFQYLFSDPQISNLLTKERIIALKEELIEDFCDILLEYRLIYLYDLIAVYPRSKECLIEMRQALYYEYPEKKSRAHTEVDMEYSSFQFSQRLTAKPIVDQTFLHDYSKPSQQFLKSSARTNAWREYLIRCLRQNISYRLLHPSVSTTSILSFYFLALSALSVLDPVGSLAEATLEDVNYYIRHRQDGLRQFFTILLDDMNAEMLLGSPMNDTSSSSSSSSASSSS